MVSASLMFLYAFGLLLQAHAAPTSLPRVGVTSISAAQVSAYLSYTLLTRVGYCPASKTATWKCGAACDALPGFVPFGAGGDGVVTPYWYVGYYPTLNSVVIANQGTDSSKFIPILVDGDFPLDSFDTALYPGLPTTIKAHGGFLDAQSRGAASKLAAVKKALATYSGASISAVGHSLGAALSLLDAIYLQLQIPGAKIKVVTYGQPRVGNPAFANYLSDVSRINNKQDIVPILPGRFLGFAHASGEKHILAPSVWAACAGQDNTDPQCTTGNATSVLTGNTDDHKGPYDGIYLGNGYC